MIWSVGEADMRYQAEPRRLAELATEYGEREAIARMKLDCHLCDIGAVPRERLVPFRFVRAGVTHSGWTCRCRISRLYRNEQRVLTDNDTSL